MFGAILKNLKYLKFFHLKLIKNKICSLLNFFVKNFSKLLGNGF